MDSKGFKEAAFSSIEEIVNYYDNIEDRRVVSNVEPGYLRKILPASAPEDGEPWKDIQKDMEDKIMPGITHWQSPNFMAFFPSASSFPGMLGEMWSAALTGAAFNWICSPAVTELETIVMDWLAQALALPLRYHSTGPTRGGGVIHGTASEAIVTVMVAARDKYLRETTAHLPADSQELDDAIAVKRSKLVALASASTHSSTKKAALIAGVRFHTIPVSAETGWALTGESVRQAVLECRGKGLEPFFLTTTMGTTDTCAVDAFDQIATALAEIAPLRQKGEIWVHVDAAYAGTALLCPEVRENSLAIQALLGLKDDESPFLSFNTNLHKWLLTNFDCSTLWVSDRNLLIDSLSVMPPYLRNHYSDSGLVTDYRDWQIPLGRRFRSLKVWFVLRTYGIKGLQAHLRRTMKLGELFADLVKGRPDLFKILTGPSYALTVFKLVGASVEQRNARTKQSYEKINHEGKIYLTSTMLGEDFAIRVATSTPFVEEEHVRRAFGVIVEAAEEAIADQ